MRVFLLAFVVNLLLAGISASPAYAQDAETETILRFSLKDGSELYGSVLKTDASTMTIRTIWMRDMVVFKDDILEAGPVPDTREQLLGKTTVSIQDKKGSVFTGKVTAATADTIQFVTDADIALSIPQTKVLRISTNTIAPSTMVSSSEMQSASGLSRYYLKDKLFLNSTGLMPYRGDVYLGMYYIFFGTVTIGIHDNFSALLGLSLIPGASTQAFIINPKFGLYQEEYNGVAISYMFASIFEDVAGFHSFSLNGTLGHEKFQGTLGIGWGMSDGDFADLPLITAGITARMSNSVSFISENWAYLDSHDSFGIISFGLRFHGENVAGDLAFWRPILENSDFGGWPFFPMVTLFYRF